MPRSRSAPLVIRRFAEPSRDQEARLAFAYDLLLRLTTSETASQASLPISPIAPPFPQPRNAKVQP